MILIIGGAYQGKTEYAVQNYDDSKDKMINEFHLKVLEDIKNNKNTLEALKANIDDYKDKIIICDDISCGVVPLEPEMRAWREMLGRCMAYLSQNADQVIRVFCGIGTRIK
ncbi:MAG: bifunctional adenosylcobinamide kinase/adenosylcobinamide-phosphate guanylyltransferase [Cellulosilyticaceae bacterium]